MKFRIGDKRIFLSKNSPILFKALCGPTSALCLSLTRWLRSLVWYWARWLLVRALTFSSKFAQTGRQAEAESQRC